MTNQEMKNLFNAVILRTVYDALGKGLDVWGKKNKFQKERIENEMKQAAINYIENDKDFEYICSYLNLDMVGIKRGIKEVC